MKRLFLLLLQAQIAEHLGLATRRQIKTLRKKLDALDTALVRLPDELFEDDGLAEDDPRLAA